MLGSVCQWPCPPIPLSVMYTNQGKYMLSSFTQLFLAPRKLSGLKIIDIKLSFIRLYS